MLTRLDLRDQPGPSGSDRVARLRKELPRPRLADRAPIEAVREIISAVQERGDEALRQYTAEFDEAEIDEIQVPRLELDNALRDISPLLREALEEASAAVLSYHRATKPTDVSYERDGVQVRDTWRPVDRVGCYVPGGSAQYPSSVIMTAIPARVAGVENVAICVAPGPDGEVPQAVLAAAALAEVDEVYRVGGAQAIAALAYGTESIDPVDVIVGPGNVYVTTAKREVASAGVVGVPSSTAGPSEIVVIADEMTPPELAAIDLLAQAEYGPHGAAWLVTWSEEVATRVEEVIVGMVARSPRQAELEATLLEGGFSVVVDDAQAAIDVAAAIAPEHLQLMTVDPESLVPLVRHAGIVFSGVSAPAAVGDYIAGPSHVLPVHGSARFASNLGVRDFLRHQHVVSLDDATLSRIAPHVAAIAEAEGLDAHAKSVRMRSRP